MTNLQMTLVAVGVGGILVTVAYNWWQDHRLRKQTHERFGKTEHDPLLHGAARTEPGLAGEHAAASNADGALAQSHTQADENSLQIPLERNLFCEFLIRFEKPYTREAWKPLIESLSNVNRKRIIYSVAEQIEATDAETPIQWYAADVFTREARILKVSVQLANRAGPLTAIEFSELLTRLRRFSESVGADLDFPDMKEIVTRAETLDEAAAALDTLLGLHCVLPDSVEETTAIDMLATAGWKAQGRQWSLLDEEGALAGMVIHNAPPRRLLSFSIDVPNSVDPVRALGEVVTVCHGMNSQFGAPLLDDSGLVLSTEAIQGIYEQLLERIRHLEDSGFKPGSHAAQTLFS